MFEKLKQIKDLRSQAKTMQNALATESVTVEKNGIKVVINGNLEITDFTVANNLAAKEIAITTKDVLNDAIKKVQKIIAQKMQAMGGFDKFGL